MLLASLDVAGVDLLWVCIDLEAHIGGNVKEIEEEA